MAQYLPAVVGGLSAASMAGDLASKYGPSVVRGVKSIANNLFSSKKRQSAAQYVKGLTKPKGWQRLGNDVVSGAKKVSGFISSGKGLKYAKDLAGDVQQIADVAKPLIGDKYHSQISSGIKQGVDTASHYHDIANQYNETGKQLANQFQQQMNARPRLQ